MSERMLTDSELETLERLKKKAKFQNQFIRSIRRTIYEMSAFFDTKEELEHHVKKWFLEDSIFWKKKGLTESEFNRAIEIIKQENEKR